jgi:hypothetical protein
LRQPCSQLGHELAILDRCTQTGDLCFQFGDTGRVCLSHRRSFYRIEEYYIM